VLFHRVASFARRRALMLSALVQHVPLGKPLFRSVLPDLVGMNVLTPVDPGPPPRGVVDDHLGEALKNQRSPRFPGASIGPRYFLQMVEDLFWLLTRKTVGYGRLFVHHLHRTVFRISPRLYYPPQLRPWPGDFDAQNRLGLLSHTAALAGGRSIRGFASRSSQPPLDGTMA